MSAMSFIALKEGVDAKILSNQCMLGILIAASVFAGRGIPFVITSICDSSPKRKANTKHATGDAFDLRLPSRYTHDRTLDDRVVTDLCAALGQDFDVVLEPDHLHCEWDPS